MVDPYNWIQTSMSVEDKNLFKREEEEFYNCSLFRYDMLHKVLLREQEFYQHIPKVLPVRVGEYIYYRRFENPADAITLYRFPIEELKKRGLNEGEMPNLMINHDDMIEKDETISEFPEQTVFSIDDLKLFYADFATKDPRIKEFVERITDFVVTQDHMPLHYFQINEEQKFAVLSFDTDMPYEDKGNKNKSLDLIVKDLTINRLFPVLILNSDGDIAFDRFNGFYYTQVEGSRGTRVFRHQLGTLHSHDQLIYEEKNPDFSVSVENTLSSDYIMIKIRSLYKPTTNEVWLKHAGKDADKFWLVQPMQQGVRYTIKHSGEFLYKMSNEEDKINFKITKIRVPEQVKIMLEETITSRLV